ncbi:type IV pilus secretin PilQ [uncultured Methylibium sp.]|uniref:type IV pilus secretin PilQ n=1 Tax=uncultured Methylibium sp. TaxID=381093 RepID=UPI0025F820D4|nr:type IV pilus secretin PilQ [uncultured Methylibium sp.]
MRTAWEITTMNQWRVAAVALSMLLAAFGASAQNAIQSINSTQQGTADVVRIELSEPLAAVPTGFAVQTPPRVAIDLPGISNAMGRSTVDINQGNLRSVGVAQAGDRTRLVLNLRQPGTYAATLEGKVLVLTLQTTGSGIAAAASPSAPAAATAATPSPVRFADSQNQAPQVLRQLDFRRGPDGAGRVVVELPSNQVGVDIRQQGQNLVVEFLKTNLPENLRRRLDVTDFGTPVRTVSTFQSGDKVRMVVEPTGVWEHSAYQTDNQFVLEVRPQKVDPNKLTQGPGYAGEKLSLNFQSIEVRALLQVIADFTNFNVVTSDTVTGNVTLRLKDVPWDQALDIILQAKGLGVRKSGNVLWIAPKDEIATKEKLELESKAQIASLEPVRTQAFQLNYVKAEEVAKGLTGQQSGQNSGGGGGSGGQSTNSRILSPRGSLVYESRTNQLFISDIPSKLEEVAQIIARIDIPVRQVLIEARIVEATDTFGQSLGVKLGVNQVVPSRNVAYGGNYLGVGETTGQTPPNPGGYVPNTYLVNLPAIGQNGYNAGSFAVSLFNSAMTRFLNLEISALEADGKGKIVSSPRIVTADQVKALIEQGTEIPYQTATSSGATAIQFRKAVLKLEVTPQITPEGNIILDVDVNKDSAGATTAAGILINTKHVKTQVLVDNGGTVVIGGIFEQTEQTDTTKVPVLGDVPYLGALFRTKTRTANKTELLVFLTPKVVMDRSSAAAQR